MLVSIIVPVYNAEKYLSQCIESIINQTYKNLEIILVDDGSKDSSGQICDIYSQKDSRIRVVHKENGGVSVARNTGLDIANGEFIAFVDADDYLLESMIEKLYFAIDGKDISMCRYLQVKPNSVVKCYEKNLEFFKKAPYDFKYIMVDKYSKTENDTVITDKIFGSVWRTLFRKNIIDDKNIRFSKGIKIAEDRLFLLEYCGFCKNAGVVDEYLYGYRVGLLEQATAVFNKYQPNLEKSQKLLVQKQIELINSNLKLSKKEKKSLINFLNVKATYAVTLNEIRFNSSNSISNLKKIFNDKFYSKAIRFRFFYDLYKNYNVAVKILILYVFIKFKLWWLLKKIIFKHKGRKNG